MPCRLILVALGCCALAARAADAPSSPGKTEAAAKTTATDAKPFHHDESDVPDSIGAITVRPVPEADEPEPAYLKQVDYFRQQHDHVMASSYLEKVALNPEMEPRERARAILELADELEAQQRSGDELCWLKVWMQLYPQRPEVGAVAYRMGALYTRMGLTQLARDSYYLALSNAVNHGEVRNSADLKQYTRLTSGTLWALAQNEYQAGDWQRAAELFDRFRHEAQSPAAGELVRSQYLQADCYYQLHDREKAAAVYTDALNQHPFHPLAPEARLRLYHLDIMAKKPAEAQAELAALVWSVRTVWPKDEAYWQKRTAQLLLALNHENAEALPPLVRKSAELTSQDKAWQADLGHYDKLASLVATMPQESSSALSSTPPGAVPGGLAEQEDLEAMSRSIHALPPAAVSPAANP